SRATIAYCSSPRRRTSIAAWAASRSSTKMPCNVAVPHTTARLPATARIRKSARGMLASVQHRHAVEVHLRQREQALEAVAAVVEPRGGGDEPLELRDVLPQAQGCGQVLPQREDVLVRHVARPVRTAQLLRERRHHHR